MGAQQGHRGRTTVLQIFTTQKEQVEENSGCGDAEGFAVMAYERVDEGGLRRGQGA